jgi:hypothetical protein
VSCGILGNEPSIERKAKYVKGHFHTQRPANSLELLRKESGNVVRVLKGGVVAKLSVADQLSSLPRLHKEALSGLWRELFRDDPPLRMRKELLVQFLAYRTQEREFGQLSERSQRRLSQLAKAIEDTSKISSPERFAIKPGTRLIRQWKDQVHIVNVEEGSYEYRCARYHSLSEIARLITGTRWSGPLFFGLKPGAIKESKEDA